MFHPTIHCTLEWNELVKACSYAVMTAPRSIHSYGVQEGYSLSDTEQIVKDMTHHMKDNDTTVCPSCEILPFVISAQGPWLQEEHIQRPIVLMITEHV